MDNIFDSSTNPFFTLLLTIWINFSNDLVSPLNRQPGLGNVIGTAAGNNNYGWFDFTYGTTYRLDFSNDSLLATRGPLTSTTYRAATSNTPVG